MLYRWSEVANWSAEHPDGVEWAFDRAIAAGIQSERRLVSKLVRCGGIQRALDAGISYLHFHAGDDDQWAFDCLEGVTRDSDVEPSEAEVCREFDDYELVDTPEGLDHYIEEFLANNRPFLVFRLLAGAFGQELEDQPSP